MQLACNSRHRSARRAGVAAVAVLLLAGMVASQVLGAWHVLRHEHRYCAEHEAFEEAGSSTAQASAGRPGPGERASPATAGDDRHEACGFTGCLSSGASIAPRTATELAAPLATAAVSPVPCDVAARVIPILRAAPKQSPPARA